MTDKTTPQLSRIVMATFTSDDLANTAAVYEQWLGYRVVDEAGVPAEMAQSWGAPACEGRAMITMASNEADRAYIRAVEGVVPEDYAALNSWGWNGIEIIVEDVHALSEQLAASTFRELGAPLALTSYPSIVAMQVEGPSREVLYLTMQTDYSGDTPLPRPGAFVGRPFIAVLGGPDMEAMLGWYAEAFALPRRLSTEVPIPLLAREQGLDDDHAYPIATMQFAQKGNLIEFDGYPERSRARQCADGDLPPGVAMFTFATPDLGATGPRPLAPPIAVRDSIYAGARTMTLAGPAGELIELIETPLGIRSAASGVLS